MNKLTPVYITPFLDETGIHNKKASRLGGFTTTAKGNHTGKQ